MRVALFGYQTWGHRLLQALLDSRHEVVLLVTHPAGNDPYEQLWPDAVDELALEHAIPTIYRDQALAGDAELAERIRQSRADIIVAVNWRTWIAPAIFSIPRYGTLNTHDSLLPRYAGFAPITWALINGEERVGVTVHEMDSELDTGDIVLQRSVEVEPHDTSASLVHKTLDLFGPLTIDALELIESGTGERLVQDRSRSSFFHKRTEEENRIDWSWSARDIVNLVRAQADPYPNAFTFRGDERIGVLEASVSGRVYGGTAGRIFYREGDGVVIACGPQCHRGRNHGLVIQRVRTEAGRELTGRAYFDRMGGYLTAHPAMRRLLA
ncbi:MAG: methionyl-tRNA formyltransferase [Solirubrobacteraceae bacterium]|jgi:methionyl-tRNA formyltransferase|nr:methionyl-tRNA formyltransferase [Solirubrobacteraceae bacterium]MEA2138142.1 methionyl-tRNA formyltransferase [Solirubrobacteraceae bacterium]